MRFRKKSKISYKIRRLASWLAVASILLPAGEGLAFSVASSVAGESNVGQWHCRLLNFDPARTSTRQDRDHDQHQEAPKSDAGDVCPVCVLVGPGSAGLASLADVKFELPRLTEIASGLPAAEAPVLVVLRRKNHPRAPPATV